MTRKDLPEPRVGRENVETGVEPEGAAVPPPRGEGALQRVERGGLVPRRGAGGGEGIVGLGVVGVAAEVVGGLLTGFAQQELSLLHRPGPLPQETRRLPGPGRPARVWFDPAQRAQRGGEPGLGRGAGGVEFDGLLEQGGALASALRGVAEKEFLPGPQRAQRRPGGSAEGGHGDRLRRNDQGPMTNDQWGEDGGLGHGGIGFPPDIRHFALSAVSRRGRAPPPDGAIPLRWPRGWPIVSRGKVFSAFPFGRDGRRSRHDRQYGGEIGPGSMKIRCQEAQRVPGEGVGGRKGISEL